MIEKCKVCGYQRQPDDIAPDYQCPKCSVVYTKADNYLKKKAAAKLTKEKKQKKKPQKKAVVVKNYIGKQEQANASFQKDSTVMLEHGYHPTNQSWSEGQYGCGAFLLAVLLIFFFGIGLLIIAYMIIVKPAGTLAVTYELKKIDSTHECPRCAETIKLAAKVCRFCGYEF